MSMTAIKPPVLQTRFISFATLPISLKWWNVHPIIVHIYIDIDQYRVDRPIA